MRRLLYDAPPNHVLDEGDRRIRGGQTFDADDERALELLTDPTVNVTEATEQVDLDALSRRQLDEIARNLGIDPEKLPSKAAVIEAINTPQAGQVGDGDTPTDMTEEVTTDVC